MTKLKNAQSNKNQQRNRSYTNIIHDHDQEILILQVDKFESKAA
jgi:hypothetical protein